MFDTRVLLCVVRDGVVSLTKNLSFFVFWQSQLPGTVILGVVVNVGDVCEGDEWIGGGWNVTGGILMHFVVWREQQAAAIMVDALDVLLFLIARHGGRLLRTRRRWWGRIRQRQRAAATAA